MDKCVKCGHGRQWHRLPLRVSGWQRTRNEKPKRLGCRFRHAYSAGATSPVIDTCKCRDFRPVEVRS